MTSITAWAKDEFGAAVLGDVRRTRRLVQLAEAFARSPAGPVTEVVSGAAAREGAFRFVENDSVEPGAIARAHHEATARRCSGKGLVIVAVDQVSLTLTDKVGKPGFGSTGPIADSGRRRGFQVMNALVIDEHGAVQGLVGQEWWSRSGRVRTDHRRDARPAEQRESDLWRRALIAANEHIGQSAPGTRPWFQMDRGADFHRVLSYATKHGVLMTVRSAYDRALADGGRLRRSLRRAKIQGEFTARSRLHAGGVMKLRLRAGIVDLLMGDAKGRRIGIARLGCVHVKEARPWRGTQAVEWWLLTTAPVDNVEQAIRVASNYTRRWRVEEFHRAWKSGVCNIERSQLRSARAFMRWASIGAAVAARAEHLKTASRAEPGVDALRELSRAEIDAAIILSNTKMHSVGATLTLEQAVRLIADIGGYTGKSSGGPPGARVIARGLERVAPGAKMAEWFAARK